MNKARETWINLGLTGRQYVCSSPWRGAGKLRNHPNSPIRVWAQPFLRRAFTASDKIFITEDESSQPMQASVMD